MILHLKVKIFTIFVWGFEYKLWYNGRKQTDFLISNTNKEFIKSFIIFLDSRQRGEDSSGEIWEGEIEERLQDSPRHEQPALGEKSGV